MEVGFPSNTYIHSGPRPHCKSPAVVRSRCFSTVYPLVKIFILHPRQGLLEFDFDCSEISIWETEEVFCLL